MPVLRPELVKLHRMPESERSDRIASEEFKSKFTPAEQQMLAEISPYFPFSRQVGRPGQAAIRKGGAIRPACPIENKYCFQSRILLPFLNQ